MAESTSNGVKHMLKKGETPLHMKVDGHILEAWFQDELNREKYSRAN